MRHLLLAAAAGSCLLAAAPAGAQSYPSPRYDEDRAPRGYGEERGRGYDRDDDRRRGRDARDDRRDDGRPRGYGRDEDRRGRDDDRRGREDNRRGRDEDRRGDERRGPPQPPAATPRGGASALCITSRGNCGTRPLPIGAPCTCDLPGVGRKRGNVGSYGN